MIYEIQILMQSISAMQRKWIEHLLLLKPCKDMYNAISDIMAHCYDMWNTIVNVINFCKAKKLNCALMLILSNHYGR